MSRPQARALAHTCTLQFAVHLLFLQTPLKPSPNQPSGAPDFLLHFLLRSLLYILAFPSSTPSKVWCLKALSGAGQPDSNASLAVWPWSSNSPSLIWWPSSKRWGFVYLANIYWAFFVAGQHCMWICSIFSTTPLRKIPLLSFDKGEVRQREFRKQASHPASEQRSHPQGGVCVQCLAYSGPSESGKLLIKLLFPRRRGKDWGLGYHTEGPVSAHWVHKLLSAALPPQISVEWTQDSGSHKSLAAHLGSSLHCILSSFLPLPLPSPNPWAHVSGKDELLARGNQVVATSFPPAPGGAWNLFSVSSPWTRWKPCSYLCWIQS